MRLRQFQLIEATIRLRRGDGWNVRPEAERLEGKRLTLFINGKCERRQYRGEWECMSPSDGPDELRVGWIASGDLTDIKVLPSRFAA